MRITDVNNDSPESFRFRGIFYVWNSLFYWSGNGIVVINTEKMNRFILMVNRKTAVNTAVFLVKKIERNFSTPLRKNENRFFLVTLLYYSS